jgi:hypothetical protein
MPLGYKYAERDVDSFVDWSAVGKNLSSALATEAQDRRDKIQAFEDQNLKDIDFLNRAPQGKYDPANKFTNNFAHDVKEQNAINYKLLRAGKLQPRQFTLNRQNMMNGTNQLFDLQKTYQEEFDKRMAGIQSGDLQALNIANMEYVEMFGDFSKSKGIINPLDGTVNIGIMALNPKTGVMELTKDVMPVSVAMGKLRTEIKTFKVDEEINKSIEAFGDRKDAIYIAATTSGAGTITELTGVGALQKYSAFKDVITEFNKAVDGTIAGYFSGNTYNVSSVLTENTGKYNAKSYIYDKEQAAKDPTKLLLKIDPSTGLPVLDESAPHYAKQKKEAEAWVRTQIMNRLDSERKIGTTSQLDIKERRALTGDEYKRIDEKKEANNLAEQISNIIKGSAADVDGGLRYFAGLGIPIRRTRNAIFVPQLQADGKTTKEIPYYFSRNGVLSNPLNFGKSMISAVNAKGLREDLVATELKRFLNPNSTINTQSEGSGYARTRNVKTAFTQKANNEIATPDLFLNKDKFATISELKRRLSGIKGLTIESVPSASYSLTGGRSGNDIVIKYGKDVVNINSNQDNQTDAEQQKNNVVDFLQKLPENIQEQFLGPDLTEQQAKSAEESGKGVLD